MPDRVGEMFYYGAVPWHGKGRRLEQPANTEEALRAGGLAWRVRLVPLQTKEHFPRPITRRVAVVRDGLTAGGERDAVLGVVYPGFRPLQNREAVEVFDKLLGHGRRVYHTGGYLGKGEVIWLLAKLPEDITVSDGDVVEPYMLLANSHDGTIAIDFRLTTVRVVCQNTLALAMQKDRSSHIFKRAHQVRAEILAEQAKEFFKFCTKAATGLGETFQKMHSMAYGPDDFARLVARLQPLPPPPDRLSVDAARRRHDEQVHRITELRESITAVFVNGISNGFRIQPAEKTLWGALNAITAFVDHKQEITGERYAHILFGSGANLKRRAYDLVLEQLSKN